MRKIPTLFVRDFEHDNGRYVTREVTPGCEWVLEGLGHATRKLDGTCTMFDGEQWWARREVRPGKDAPSGYLEVERDETTGKRFGWEPIEQSSFAKVFDMVGHKPTVPGTYELIGPKVNGNPERAMFHLLIRHGQFRLDGPLSAEGPRSFDTLRAFLRRHPFEGIVFWLGGPDDPMAKIKARDFA